MRRLVPIGRFAQITRLTPKALRLYDEIGLLEPEHVDETTGYRYYSLGQVQPAARIRMLRVLEMPLEEIRQILAESDPQRARALLGKHRERLEQRIAASTRAIALLDRLPDTGSVPGYDGKVKRVAEQPIAFISAATSLGEMDASMPAAFAELYAFLQRRGLSAAGPPFCAYPYPEESADEFAGDACVPLSVPVSAEGRVRTAVLPAGQVAWALHVGPYEELPLLFEAMLAWIYEHGHDISGPLREIYRVSPSSGAAPLDFVTEIAWPLR